MKTPQELLEDDMINFYADMDTLEDKIKMESFLIEIRNRYGIEVSSLLNNK